MAGTLSKDSGEVGSSLISAGHFRFSSLLRTSGEPLFLGDALREEREHMDNTSLSDMLIPNLGWVLFYQLIYLINA